MRVEYAPRKPSVFAVLEILLEVEQAQLPLVQAARFRSQLFDPIERHLLG